MPKKLTFATELSFAKGPMFIAFLVFAKLLRRSEADVQYTIIETILVKIINKRVVTS